MGFEHLRLLDVTTRRLVGFTRSDSGASTSLPALPRGGRRLRGRDLNRHEYWSRVDWRRQRCWPHAGSVVALAYPRPRQILIDAALHRDARHRRASSQAGLNNLSLRPRVVGSTANSLALQASEAGMV